MKIKLLACLLVLLFGLPLMAAPPKGKSAQDDGGALTVDNAVYINANKILMFVTNHGNFGRDLGGRFGYDYGTFFPYTSVEAIDNGSNVLSPYYAGGIWVGARDSATGDTLVTVSIYSDEYVPGPSLGGTFQADRPEYHVYKTYKDSLGLGLGAVAGFPDSAYTYHDTAYLARLAWPIDQGAPFTVDTTYWYVTSGTVVDTSIRSVDTLPKFIGDQFCWSVCNDFNPAQHTNSSGSTAPLGLDIKVSTWALSREDPLGNCLFIRFQIYNRGDKVLENCLFSIWSDPDLGNANDDLVGVDTLLNLAYDYNSNNSDQKYGSTPPAIGIDFFQGPLEFTGNDLTDSAKMWGTWFHGYKNMGMYSFNKYINGTDPNDFRESYQFMAGLDAKNSGAPFINPTTGQVTRFVMTGDPVTQTGWLDNTPADRRMQETTGPLTFRPGDSTEIVCAMVIGRGGDRLSSISVMKYFDRFAQDAYDKDFILAQPPASPIVTVGQEDGRLSLMWTDTSEIDHGDFPFEGYTVLQGPSSNGPWTRIANYDVINGFAQIQDEVLDPGTGALETRAVKFGSDSGIRRYFVVDQDYLTGSALFNMNTYFFRVEAYSYDRLKTPKTLTSANRRPIELIPQAPPAGVEPQQALQSDIDVAHAGVSDGTVTVEVLDPLALNGHDYEVTFHYFPPDTTITFTRDTTDVTYDTLTDTCNMVFQGDTLWVAVLCVDTIYTIDPPVEHVAIDSVKYWNLTDLTLDSVILSEQLNQSGDEDYLVRDGFLCKVAGPAPGVRSFAMVSNAAGPLDPPGPGSAAFAGFPTPDGTGNVFTMQGRDELA